MLTNKILLIVSYWGYPFGGGEEYLYQTAIWSTKEKIKTYWICFSDASNKKYDELSISDVDGFKIIKIPNGFNKDVLCDWVRLINPDIVHHQGHLRKEFYEVCASQRIPFLTGMHFWTGIIKLDSKTYNHDILKNISSHCIDNEFLELYDSKYCNLYSVSKFVTECVHKLTDKKINHTIYSGSSKIKCLLEKNDPLKNKYVTVINIHKKKGGELVLYLLENLVNIPFIVVRTEYESEELDEKIQNVINGRKENNNALCLFMDRLDDIRPVIAQTKIFLAPSIVDETFCRTVNEMMMNDVPVITTGCGNIKYLVENAGIIIDYENKRQWLNTVDELYNNETKMNEIISKTKIKYKEYSEEKCKNMYVDVVSQVLEQSKSNNIAIFVPWCDQGLGIQGRNYYNILCNNGYNTYIFSYNPYSGPAIELQKNPNEWNIKNVYYSSYDREHVKDSELLSFIKKHDIGKFIIPETCWYRIFDIARLMRENDVKCYAIPNIEIIRKDEMTKHKYFYKILCNNYACEKLFNYHNITNNEYVGYGIFDDKIQFRQKKCDDIIKFLFIGGMNAFSRKQIFEICEGFAQAYKINDKIHLTCTIQKTNLLEKDDVNKIEKYFDHPGITFIQKHLQYEDIIGLYYAHHVSIQLSKHEGLGLGFYEAVATGTPVLSLKTPPHNEIIIDNVNGWLIDCFYKDMMDNPNAFIQSAYFHPSVLCSKILEIANSDLQKISDTLMMDYNKRLSPYFFIKRFINALT